MDSPPTMTIDRGSLLLSLLAVCFLVSCEEPRAHLGESAMRSAIESTFSDVFEVVGSLTLDETADVVTVQPFVYADGHGHFVLAETLEGQVRVYSTSGELDRVLGRRGEGPGEFSIPLSARMSTDGSEVVVTEVDGTVTFFGLNGADGVVTKNPGSFVALFDAIDLGDGRYLLVGEHFGDESHPLLHVWNREEDVVEYSFFPMPEVPQSASGMIMANATVTGDTVWAVFSLADSVYVFGVDGSRLDAIPLSLGFDLGEHGASGKSGDGAESVVSQVFNLSVLGNGDLVVQVGHSSGSDFVSDLLILDRQGRMLARADGVSRLMVVDQDLFYFQSPVDLLPNRWLVARRRVAS